MQEAKFRTGEARAKRRAENLRLLSSDNSVATSLAPWRSHRPLHSETTPRNGGCGIDPVDDLIGEEQAFADLDRGDMMRTAIAGTFTDGDNLIISHMLKFDPLARDD